MEINDNILEQAVRSDLPDRFSEVDFFKRNFSRIINIFNGNILPPYEILIHTSSICNLHCEWCIGNHVTSKKNRSSILETKLDDIGNMKKIVDGILNYKKIGINYETEQCEEYRTENISFSGITGEPIISKKTVLYAIEEFVKNGLRVGMFTNGTLLTEDTHESICKMAYVLISIDASKNSTYSKLKLNGKESNMLDKIFENIQDLTKLKQKQSSNLDINVGFVINQHNYNEIYELAKILKDIGIHYFRIKTDIASEMVINKEQLEKIKLQIEYVRETLCDNNFSIVEIHKLGDEKQKIRDFNKCFIHYLFGAISADGKVYPCNYHPRVNGYSYDSAIDNKFGYIWENIMKYEIDKNLPEICPDRCDPFKNRANKMLEIAYKIYTDKGVQYLKNILNEIN